jgi:hypothetical protein
VQQFRRLHGTGSCILLLLYLDQEGGLYWVVVLHRCAPLRLSLAAADVAGVLLLLGANSCALNLCLADHTRS